MADTKIVITAEDQTKAIFQNVQKNADLASSRFSELSKSMNTAFSSQFTNNVRNASYQITDFITQVQGGQRASLAMAQQLPQMLAGFGAAGAAAGVVAASMPALIAAFSSTGETGKKLETALGDLGSALGEVGKTTRDFSMDGLFREFNQANAVTRKGILEQLEFQRVLIETQNLQANSSLSKSLEGIGSYGTFDKLKGAFAPSGAEKLSDELGISVRLAGDLLPAIKELRDGTGDAQNFMQRFGVELAKSTNMKTQQLVKDIRAVAEGSKDAAAAQSRLSEAIDKMQKAGATGTINIPGAAGKVGKWQQSPSFQAWVQEQSVGVEQRSAKSVMDELRAHDKALESLAGKYKAMADPLQKYRDQLDEINRLRTDGLLTADQAIGAEWEVNLALDAAAQKMAGFGEEIKKTKSFSDELGLAFTSAFEDAIVGGKSLSDVLKGIEQDIIRIAVRKSVTEPLGDLIGGLFEGFSIAKLFGFADGGVMTATGPLPLRSYASGGVASSPQLALFGEGSTPEAFVPLPDGRSIPVTMQGGGGVQVNVINNASGTQATARERNDGGIRIVDVLIENVESRIAGGIASGRGPIPAALASSYGLNRAAGAF